MAVALGTTARPSLDMDGDIAHNDAMVRGWAWLWVAAMACSADHSPRSPSPDATVREDGGGEVRGDGGEIEAPIAPDGSVARVDGASDAAGARGGSDAAVADAQAPDTDDLGDPEPVEVSLEGLVETSSRWLLYTEVHSSVVPQELMLIDLESGERHLATPTGRTWLTARGHRTAPPC